MKGSLRVKDGMYYAVISYKNELGQYKQKWITTGLKERGNKKAAQKILEEEVEKFQEPIITENPKPQVKNDIIFVNYVEDYVKAKEKELSPAVFVSYNMCVKIIKEYFGNKLKLKDVTYHHLEDFYDYLRNERKNKNVTVKHHAVILSPALRQAYRDDLIAKNPYEFMPKIKKEKTKMEYYNKDELEKLFEATDNTPLALIVRGAAYYGFRRSELIGLKWEAIDFDNKMISIKHKVLNVNGEFYLSDTLKTQASNRTLPLLPEIEKLFIERKEQIEKNKKLYGKSYNYNYTDYVFVDDIGDLINPNHVSDRFRNILKKNNLKHIRFHDLRHSCASLLVANKVPMKNIQEWLGHSNFNTTADVYSHLDYSTKLESASTISSALNFSNKENVEETEEEIDDEIEKLERMLEEKRLEKRKRNKDFEM